jgi:hypothetical protein
MIIKYMNYEYYYNNVPGVGLCRNNLIYTSLISQDKKTFVMWFHNDSEYHKGQNEVVDPILMNAKWNREVKYLIEMAWKYREMVPKIKEIDHINQKIYFEIDGADFWNRAGCMTENYDTVLPDWQDQMLRILTAHRSLGLYKFSMHPSSYFIVDGQLKSINYFFCYHESEGPISINDHLSHIHSNRQEEMRKHTDRLGISWDKPQSLSLLQDLCWESFRTNYPEDFIEKAKCIK